MFDLRISMRNSLGGHESHVKTMTTKPRLLPSILSSPVFLNFQPKTTSPRGERHLASEAFQRLPIPAPPSAAFGQP